VSPVDWSAPFEDLAHGMRFTTHGRTITDADLVCFAALTGDMHPQHIDAAWAAASSFGERIAHGMLLISYASGLVPFDPSRVLALRRISNVVFKRPAKIGDTIHVAGQIASLNAIDDSAGLVGWQWDIRDTGELLLCRAAVDVVWASDGERTERAARAGSPTIADEIGLPPGVIPC
jgi:acyl dehydratase